MVHLSESEMFESDEGISNFLIARGNWMVESKEMRLRCNATFSIVLHVSTIRIFFIFRRDKRIIRPLYYQIQSDRLSEDL